MGAKRIIIVGAGPGGLTSAMILAHRGFEVTVFEKEAAAGGRNAPIRLDGFTFDTGPTFLMMNFVLKEMFEEAGRNAQDYISVTKLDPLYRLKFSDFELRPTNDHNDMKRQLDSLFPGSSQGYDKFRKVEKTRFEKIFPCLQKPYSRISDYFFKAFLNGLPYLSLGKTMFQKLGDYFEPDDLRLSFTFQSKYLGMSAWECPAVFNIIPFVEHEYGVYHVTGGLNAISLAMEKVIEEEGGTIHKNTPVQSLIIDGRTVKGVELANGEKQYADYCFINADFAYAMTNIVDQTALRKYTQAKFKRMKFSCSTYMLYLGIKKIYDIPHHNIIFANDYKANVEDIFVNRKLSADNSFYIQNASVTDPTLAPEGHSTIYMLVPVPNNRSGIDWDAEKDRFRDHILDQVERKTELKDVRQHIEAEKIITPTDWENDYNVYTGATFNLGHNFTQMLYFRPRNKFEEFNNCYLVGGGTHPGSGLPTIYESARISSNMLSKECGVAFSRPSTLSSKHMFS